MRALEAIFRRREGERYLRILSWDAKKAQDPIEMDKYKKYSEGLRRNLPRIASRAKFRTGGGETRLVKS